MVARTEGEGLRDRQAVRQIYQRVKTVDTEQVLQKKGKKVTEQHSQELKQNRRKIPQLYFMKYQEESIVIQL